MRAHRRSLAASLPWSDRRARRVLSAPQTPSICSSPRSTDQTPQNHCQTYREAFTYDLASSKPASSPWGGSLWSGRQTHRRPARRAHEPAGSYHRHVHLQLRQPRQSQTCLENCSHHRGGGLVDSQTCDRVEAIDLISNMFTEPPSPIVDQQPHSRQRPREKRCHVKHV